MKKIIHIVGFFLMANFTYSQCLDCPEICEGDPNPEICAYTTDPGGVDITWSDGQTGNCITPTDILPDDYTYTVTVTDPAGICTPLEGCIDLVINPNPEIECRIVTPDETIDLCEGTFCPGTFVRANVVGELPGSTFVWTSSSGEGSPGNDPMNFNIPVITTSTVIDVVVTTPNGCVRELTFTITVEPEPILDCSNIVDTCDGDNGSIIATSSVLGGTWTIAPVAGTNAGNGTFTDLPAGDYEITFVSDAGCEATCEFTIEGSTLPGLDLNCTPQN